MIMQTPADVLIVDDTPENIDVLADTLDGLDCQIRAATSGGRALALVAQKKPALILLDVNMPGMDGFETCRRLKSAPASRDIPVIFVTARHEDVAMGFEVGGADYITKPIRATEVRARVKHQLERVAMLNTMQALNRELEERVHKRTAELTVSNQQLRQEINERRYMQERLNYLASHDFLTRLYNRNALAKHVAEQLARTRGSDAEFAFLLVDIAQFRLVNENCGCIAGDELLCRFADAVSGALSRGDFLARLGGDKFAIVSEVTAPGHGERLAQSIVAQLKNFEFRWESRVFRFGATIAIVSMDRSVGSFDQLMLMADETSYLAKREGRGVVRCCVHSGRYAQDHRETINWTLLLMDAIAQNHLRVHFQRLQPLAPGLGGLRVELLMRLWDPRTQQLILPGSFIPAAERFQLVVELDRWMLQEAIRFLGRERELHALLGHVTVNLSALSMRDSLLADHIIALLDEHAVPAHLVCFEITETEAIVNLDKAREFMSRLQGIGCQFSLDDFGSGFASYGYLRELNFDTLKIDGVFVHDMDVEETHAAMVRSMCDMARLLGTPIVAERVESPAIVDQLRGMGVGWVQGFHFHRPEPLTADAIRWQADQARDLVTATADRGSLSDLG